MFETLGEKRLVTHLIGGLVRIMTQVSTAIKDSADSDRVKAQFPVDRVKDGAVRPGFEG